MTTPIAENLMSGMVHFDDRSDMQPGDQIRIGIDPANHFYEIIAIHMKEDPILLDVYDHQTDQFQTMTKPEFQETLQQDAPCFLWKLLYREIVPIGDDSLLLYMYAAEYPEVDGYVIHFGWIIEDEHPPTSVSTFDYLGNYGVFEDLHTELNEEDNAFDGLVNKFSADSDMEELLEFTFYAAEYNANKYFTVETDPIYSDEMEKRLSDYATEFSA